LADAKRRVVDEGSGVIIHGVSQEGADMGYGGHLQLYLAYQKLGMDRAQAGKRVSGQADPRSFADAAQILRYLGVKGVRLMTNNPKKISDLEEGGIKVERVPSIIPKEERSSRVSALIAEKKAAMGHLY
jgi:3,4-dihydroxy 2-butanone 4-phosphate synthase/GTP cyclohydrolase II